MNSENACIALYLSALKFRGNTCSTMFQYDLYQCEQIEVGYRVFFSRHVRNMPIGTVKEKYVHWHAVVYYVHYDDAHSSHHLTFILVSNSREDGKCWLQLYTEEKLNYLKLLEMSQRSYKQRFGPEYSDEKLAEDSEKPVRQC